MIAQNFQPEPKHDAMIGPVTALPARCLDVQNERHADAATYIDAGRLFKLLDLPGNAEFCKHPVQCRRATKKTL